MNQFQKYLSLNGENEDSFQIDFKHVSIRGIQDIDQWFNQDSDSPKQHQSNLQSAYKQFMSHQHCQNDERKSPKSNEKGIVDRKKNTTLNTNKEQFRNLCSDSRANSHLKSIPNSSNHQRKLLNEKFFTDCEIGWYGPYLVLRKCENQKIQWINIDMWDLYFNEPQLQIKRIFEKIATAQQKKVQSSPSSNDQINEYQIQYSNQQRGEASAQVVTNSVKLNGNSGTESKRCEEQKQNSITNCKNQNGENNIQVLVSSLQPEIKQQYFNDLSQSQKIPAKYLLLNSPLDIVYEENIQGKILDHQLSKSNQASNEMLDDISLLNNKNDCNNENFIIEQQAPVSDDQDLIALPIKMEFQRQVNQKHNEMQPLQQCEEDEEDQFQLSLVLIRSKEIVNYQNKVDDINSHSLVSNSSDERLSSSFYDVNQKLNPRPNITKNQQPQNEDEMDVDVDSGIEIHFQNIHDFIDFTEYSKQICIICMPRLSELYEYEKNIGSGSQAQIDIYRSLLTDNLQEHGGSASSQGKGIQYAVKTYDLRQLNDQKQSNKQYVLRALFSEVKFLKELNLCENIISLEQVFKSSQGYHLVLNFAQYGCLRDYIIKHEIQLQESYIKQIMTQLLLAVDFMHRKNIVHRDIKPENILILDQEQLQVCFADLGLACQLNDSRNLFIKCGTPGYVDPDVLRGKQFSEKSDIFSLGSLFFNLISGRLLFSGKDCKQILLNNKQVNPQHYVDRTCINVSEKCRDLLKIMISPTQESRPTAEECTKHEWFKDDHDIMNELINLNKNEMVVSISSPSNNMFTSLKNFNTPIGNSNKSLSNNIGSQFRSGIQAFGKKHQQEPLSFASFIQGADYFYKQQEEKKQFSNKLLLCQAIMEQQSPSISIQQQIYNGDKFYGQTNQLMSQNMSNAAQFIQDAYQLRISPILSGSGQLVDSGLQAQYQQHLTNQSEINKNSIGSKKLSLLQQQLLDQFRANKNQNTMQQLDLQTNMKHQSYIQNSINPVAPHQFGKQQNAIFMSEARKLNAKRPIRINYNQLVKNGQQNKQNLALISMINSSKVNAALNDSNLKNPHFTTFNRESQGINLIAESEKIRLTQQQQYHNLDESGIGQQSSQQYQAMMINAQIEINNQNKAFIFAQHENADQFHSKEINVDGGNLALHFLQLARNQLKNDIKEIIINNQINKSDRIDSGPPIPIIIAQNNNQGFLNVQNMIQGPQNQQNKFQLQQLQIQAQQIGNSIIVSQDPIQSPNSNLGRDLQLENNEPLKIGDSLPVLFNSQDFKEFINLSEMELSNEDYEINQNLQNYNNEQPISALPDRPYDRLSMLDHIDEIQQMRDKIFSFKNNRTSNISKPSRFLM